MSVTKTRASNEINWDADIDINAKKITNLAAPTGDAHAATRKYVDDAVSGSASSVHAPLADLTACKALVSTTLTDKELMLIETLGTYRWDAQSTTTPDDVLIIRPTDISGDDPGRWLRITATLSNHNLLGGLQGGTTNEYNHLTNTEVSKLSGIEASADVTDIGNIGTAVHGATEKTSLTANDEFAMIDSEASNVGKKTLWSTIKSTLKTYFDTLYSPKWTWVTRESPTGDINGSNTDFVLANIPVSGKECVFKNGKLMNAGAGNDYTISTVTITFLTGAIPIAGDIILVNYPYVPA